jgi:hypothetical protein
MGAPINSIELPNVLVAGGAAGRPVRPSGWRELARFVVVVCVSIAWPS